QERVDVSMVFPSGATYPLGRYAYTDFTRQLYAGGQRLSNVVLNDEMFVLDQPITAGISPTGIQDPATVPSANSQSNRTAEGVLRTILANSGVHYQIAPSGLQITTSWNAGTNLGSVIESIALVGDYFSPWFGNDKLFHAIRSFDPATAVCDFDWDNSNKVI